MPQQMQNMPQQMQTNATTLRQKMHQTYVKLNAVTYITYVYLNLGSPDPSRVVLLDKVKLCMHKREYGTLALREQYDAKVATQSSCNC